MLLRRLASRLGTSQATRELRWMKQHARNAKVSLKDMVDRRLKDEPLQYILGTQPFGDLELRVRAPVLIPRPETEHWALRLAETFQPTSSRPISLLDIGTGTGCIPLLLCHTWPEGSVHATGVDISYDALDLATENARSTLTKNTFNAVHANVLDPAFAITVSPPYDVVTSNPPYISFSEYLKLPTSVSRYEDPRALFGGATEGLDFYHAIARVVSTSGFLRDDGIVALEVGHEQGSTVEEIFKDTGRFRKTEIWKDQWEVGRTVVGWT